MRGRDGHVFRTPRLPTGRPFGPSVAVLQSCSLPAGGMGRALGGGAFQALPVEIFFLVGFKWGGWEGGGRGSGEVGAGRVGARGGRVEGGSMCHLSWLNQNLVVTCAK